MMVMADLETQGHHHHHPQCTSFSLDGHPSKYWAGPTLLNYRSHCDLQPTVLVGVQPYICYRRGCDLELAMFVFLVLSMLYPNDTLTEFAKATRAVCLITSQK